MSDRRSKTCHGSLSKHSVTKPETQVLSTQLPLKLLISKRTMLLSRLIWIHQRFISLKIGEMTVQLMKIVMEMLVITLQKPSMMLLQSIHLKNF